MPPRTKGRRHATRTDEAEDVNRVQGIIRPTQIEGGTMKSLTVSLLTASLGMILLAGCANLNSAFVDANAVCRDGWYGYSRTTCQPPAAPYGVAEAERDIADLKEQIRSLKDELVTAKQVIAHLSENQANLQNQINLVKGEKHLLKTQQP
jgi:hypothetical protein